MASLLETLRRLPRLTASARDASPKVRMAVRNIDTQPPCTPAGHTDWAEGRGALLPLARFNCGGDSNLCWRYSIVLTHHGCVLPSVPLEDRFHTSGVSFIGSDSACGSAPKTYAAAFRNKMHWPLMIQRSMPPWMGHQAMSPTSIATLSVFFLLQLRPPCSLRCHLSYPLHHRVTH